MMIILSQNASTRETSISISDYVVNYVLGGLLCDLVYLCSREVAPTYVE